MKPTNSHLSEIEKEGASDYLWTPFEMDLRHAWNLMTIPNNQYIPANGLQRKAFLFSLISTSYSYKGTELDHEIIMCPIPSISFRLQKSKAVGSFFLFWDLNKAKDLIFHLRRKRTIVVLHLVNVGPNLKQKHLGLAWYWHCFLDWIHIYFRKI